MLLYRALAVSKRHAWYMAILCNMQYTTKKALTYCRLYCNVPPDLTRHLKLILSVLVCKRQSVQAYVGAHYCLDNALLNHQWHIAQLTSDQICVSHLVPVASRQQRAWPHHFQNQPQWPCWWFFFILKQGCWIGRWHIRFAFAPG